MNAFIVLPLATAVGVGITVVVLAGSTSPRRVRHLLGKRIERFASVPEDVLDTQLSNAARGAHRAVEAGVIVLLILLIRAMPIVADALARAPLWAAIGGLIVTVAASVLLGYAEIALVRAAILRRLDRNLS
jgi:hypothetical protein